MEEKEWSVEPNWVCKEEESVVSLVRVCGIWKMDSKERVVRIGRMRMDFFRRFIGSGGV